MYRTRSQAVSIGLLAIGLVNVKKKCLVVLPTWVCPRLTLYEEVTQPESPQKECRGMCQNQPHAGVAPGWSPRNRGPQPSRCPNRTPAGTGGIPKRPFRDYGNEHRSPS